ncbi:DUF4245 domain-containing protein [Pseudoclavibacter sp. CFCC 11306]|uniref:DUF4245 domain-containing protein n=1 Tax=Pseudoclavibacter sp. CFCC 11306 TaxID=1564493 RepID=UPI001300DD36|nr:DUF4245 domain-containing protein [Pseudoclavibacter sp. CFCC 11306]KAB1657124.1 DUF4245 domain-containing protein [Pseudoclavibacter sp. CFCC 11306]
MTSSDQTESTVPAAATTSTQSGAGEPPRGPVPSQASDSAKKHRAQQTLRNLILAIIACVGVLVLMLVVVPRDDSPMHNAVDYQSTAQGIQPTVDWRLAVPEPGSGWQANRADIDQEPTNQLQVWTIGFLTPKHQYIRFEQVKGANPTWVSQDLDGRRPTGQIDLSGHTFTVYDQRDSPDFQKGQNNYALTTEVSGTTLIFNGTADDDEFAQLIDATLTSLNS